MVDGSLLIVDDEVRITENIKTFFEGEGYNPLVAFDSYKALELLESHPEIELVIADISMPGGPDGYFLLNKIKQEISPFCQVIILTGYPNINGAVKAMEDGAFTYLTKPFNFSKLKQTAELALEKRKQIKAGIREELQKENLANLGKLLGGVAHNQMNPLQSVLGFAELALKEKDRNTVNEYLEKIIVSATKMRSCINSLLAKIREGYSEEIGEINLNEMIINELEILKANLFFKDEVELELDLDPKVPVIWGVYVDFSQVFLNLVNNAFDALVNSPLKKLRIASYITGKFIHLEVEDSGEGINPKHISQIFLPSFTTKARNQNGSDKPKGTGLGLYSALQIIKSYQGTIEAASQPQKTVFTMKIPVPSKNQSSN